MAAGAVPQPHTHIYYEHTGARPAAPAEPIQNTRQEKSCRCKHYKYNQSQFTQKRTNSWIN